MVASLNQRCSKSIDLGANRSQRAAARVIGRALGHASRPTLMTRKVLRSFQLSISSGADFLATVSTPNWTCRQTVPFMVILGTVVAGAAPTPIGGRCQLFARVRYRGKLPPPRTCPGVSE